MCQPRDAILAELAVKIIKKPCDPGKRNRDAFSLQVNKPVDSPH
jgi:hypothetical protein